MQHGLFVRWSRYLTRAGAGGKGKLRENVDEREVSVERTGRYRLDFTSGWLADISKSPSNRLNLLCRIGGVRRISRVIPNRPECLADEPVESRPCARVGAVQIEQRRVRQHESATLANGALRKHIRH